MIYELSRDLEARLREQRYPVRVVYGPERTAREAGGDMVIVIERDTQTSDTVRSTQGFRANPRSFAIRDLAVLARVHAYSPLRGAHRGDHERVCEQLVDALLCALRRWMSLGRTGSDLAVTEARYDVDDSVEAWPGVVYRVRFRVPRQMSELDWAGAAHPVSPPIFGITGDALITRHASADPPIVVDMP